MMLKDLIFHSNTKLKKMSIGAQHAKKDFSGVLRQENVRNVRLSILIVLNVD